MAENTKANFYRLAPCFYYFNKFFGLAAFSYNSTTKTITETVASNVYCLVVLIFTTFFYPPLIQKFVDLLYGMFKINMGTYIGMFQAIFQWFILLCIQWTCILNRNDIIEYLNLKIAYDIKITEIVPKIHRKMYFTSMTFLLFVIFVVKVLSNYFLMFTVSRAGVEVLFNLLIFIIPIAVTTLIGCNFSMEVVSIQFFASQINSVLHELAYDLKNFPKSFSMAQKMIISCQMSEKIEVLTGFYSQLSTLIRKFNKFQGFILLLYFLNKFLELLIPAFFEYLGLVGLTLHNVTFSLYINSLINDIFNVLELIMTAVCSDRLMKEVFNFTIFI